MALKNDFEATSDISSPFVDEVANPGTGSAGIDNARAAIAAEFNAARVRRNADAELKRLADAKKKPKKKSEPTKSGFLRTDPKGRREDIDNLSRR